MRVPHENSNFIIIVEPKALKVTRSTAATAWSDTLIQLCGDLAYEFGQKQYKNTV